MRGVVATGHPRVTEAAAEVLRAGGNAFDAALAAGFAAAVAEPMFSSLGGGGFLLARTGEGREVLFDFFADAPGRGLTRENLEPHFLPVTVQFPGSDQVFNIGLGSVAVPGTLRGFLHVHERLGSLPLGEVVAPAVALAREGVVLNEHQAYAIRLLEPINTLMQPGRALYAPEGRRPVEGDGLRNPELADFLVSLEGDGAREFYEGSVARRVAADMREGGGLLTLEDLKSYTVVERHPLEIVYRGRRLLTNPPPSFGGSLIATSLLLHEGHELHAARWGSTDHLLQLASVMQEVERLRVLDPLVAAPLAGSRLDEAADRVRRASGGTTHISVSDAAGNAASMTLSNGEGSGYLAPGTGVMLNNMMGEDDLHPGGFHASPAGGRVASMMSPSLLLEGPDVQLIVGSGGSKRIRTAIVQVVSGVVDFGLEVGDAVSAPRMHWDGECLQIEPGFEPDAIAGLERRWPINAWPERNLYFGGVQAVVPGRAGAGDPRRGGCATRVD